MIALVASYKGQDVSSYMMGPCNGTTYESVAAALIGRLGRDLSAKGQSIGDVLLFESLKQIVSISNLMGLKVIITDAKDLKAQNFYESYDFKAVKVKRRELILLSFEFGPTQLKEEKGTAIFESLSRVSVLNTSSNSLPHNCLS